MRSWVALLAVGVVSMAAAPAASAASGSARPIPFRVQLLAPTHTPKANTTWRYTVRVRDLAGKPVPARITVQVVDPTGTAHALTYANTNKPLVRWPIVGVFHDYAQWPPDARGFPLTFRVIVFAKGAKRTLNYVIHVR